MVPETRQDAYSRRTPEEPGGSMEASPGRNPESTESDEDEHPGHWSFKPYKEGDQVWIKGTNLQTLYPSKKLGPKQHNPFKIMKQASNTVYQVEIPQQ